MHGIVIPSTAERSQSTKDSNRFTRIDWQFEMMAGQFRDDREARVQVEYVNVGCRQPRRSKTVVQGLGDRRAGVEVWTVPDCVVSMSVSRDEEGAYSDQHRGIQHRREDISICSPECPVREHTRPK